MNRRHFVCEFVLMLFAGRERASAIYGDLLELAPTHSRLWFWMAYARTLVALGWRTPIAVLAAAVSAKYLRSSIFMLLQPVMNSNFHETNKLVAQHPHLSLFTWIVSLQTVFVLWIVLPYVAIRFGLRNRLTCLAATLFLLAIPVYTFQPHVYQLTGLVCASIVIAALVSPLWRRQMIFLLANCVAARLVFYCCISHPAMSIFRHGPFPASVFGMRIDDPVAIAITVIICPPLYRWLLQPRPTEAANA